MARAEDRRLGDITLDEVRSGKVWKLVAGEDPDFAVPLEQLGPIEDSDDFDEGDWIVYSAVFVSTDGRVKPLVLVHEFGGSYGGDYLEWVDGCWRQLGLVPDPGAPFGEEFVADPHARDASFESDTDDYRAYHRKGFARHRGAIPIG